MNTPNCREYNTFLSNEQAQGGLKTTPKDWVKGIVPQVHAACMHITTTNSCAFALQGPIRSAKYSPNHIKCSSALHSWLANMHIERSNLRKKNAQESVIGT
jgi:hypothetical protein